MAVLRASARELGAGDRGDKWRARLFFNSRPVRGFRADIATRHSAPVPVRQGDKRRVRVNEATERKANLTGGRSADRGMEMKTES